MFQFVQIQFVEVANKKLLHLKAKRELIRKRGGITGDMSILL